MDLHGQPAGRLIKSTHLANATLVLCVINTFTYVQSQSAHCGTTGVSLICPRKVSKDGPPASGLGR